MGLAERVTTGGKGNSFPLGTLWGIVGMSLRLVPRENRKLGIHLALRAAPQCCTWAGNEETLPGFGGRPETMELRDTVRI